MTEPRKVGFRLERDADGYPPAENEWLWAARAPDGGWMIDNIPWYSRDVSLGDVVEAEEDEDGQLWFRATAEPSGHSTLRVLRREQDAGLAARLRRGLEELGCTTEQYSRKLPMLAVDVPDDVDITAVVAYLDEGETGDAWGWETGLLSEAHRSQWPTQ